MILRRSLSVVGWSIPIPPQSSSCHSISKFLTVVKRLGHTKFLWQSWKSNLESSVHQPNSLITRQISYIYTPIKLNQVMDPTDNPMGGDQKPAFVQRSTSIPVPQVIVDVDAGADDAMALLLLITAHRQKKIDVLGITCVHGNSTVKNVSKNVARILDAVECYDIPVFLGAEKPLVPIDFPHPDCYPFFGTDGFGDLNLPEVSNLEVLKKENAIEALNHLITTSRSKGKVTLICLGPLTNIALAMRTYSDFVSHLEAIYIMGGNSTGIGNATSAAEFNFYNDPEAAYIVLSSAECPIKLLPWETSLHTEAPMDWRFNVLGKIDNKAIEILNAVEKKVYSAAHFSVWYPCDAAVAAIFLWPDLVLKSRECHISVELHGRSTRGQVTVDHLKNKKNNIILIEQVNCIHLQKQLLRSVRLCNAKSSGDT